MQPESLQLSRRERTVLELLVLNDYMRLKDIALKTGWAYKEASKIVSSLEKKGLVVRVARGIYVPRCLALTRIRGVCDGCLRLG